MLWPNLHLTLFTLLTTLLTRTTAQPLSKPMVTSGGCTGSQDGSFPGVYACITVTWISNSNSTITLNVTDTALDHKGVYGSYSLYYDNDSDLSTQEFAVLNMKGWGTWESSVKDWSGDGRTLKRVLLGACVWDLGADGRDLCTPGVVMTRPL